MKQKFTARTILSVLSMALFSFAAKCPDGHTAGYIELQPITQADDPPCLSTIGGSGNWSNFDPSISAVDLGCSLKNACDSISLLSATGFSVIRTPQNDTIIGTLIFPSEQKSGPWVFSAPDEIGTKRLTIFPMSDIWVSVRFRLPRVNLDDTSVSYSLLIRDESLNLLLLSKMKLFSPIVSNGRLR